MGAFLSRIVQPVTTEGPGPKPVNDPLKGVSVSGAEECDSCSLRLGTNVSTSLVVLTRSADEETTDAMPSPCDADDSIERPGRKSGKNVPGEIACEKNGITTYHRTVNREEIEAKNHCDQGWEEWSREGLEGGSVKLRCFGPCPGGQRINGGERWKCEDNDETYNWGRARRERIQRDHRPQYNVVLNPVSAVARQVKWASNKKLFIKPDKPIQLSFNGTPFVVEEMAIYRPCPIRVENIQADAVLSLNDYSTAGVSHVILIPISSGVTYGPAGDFIGRVMQNVNAFVIDEKTGQYAPIEMPTGNDWAITRLLPTGSNNEVASGYFKWSTGDFQAVTVSQSRNHIKKEWRQVGGITTIMMKEPALISYLTSTYLTMLPYAPSGESAPAPPSKYTYKKGACITCANKPSVDPAKLEEMKEETKKKLFQPSLIVAAIFGTLLVFAGAIGIYYGLKFALDSGFGASINNIVSMFTDWLISPRKKTPVAGSQ